jgi:hypothetical protein
VASARSFTESDSYYLSGSAIYDLVAGDYTLVVDGVGDAIGNYGFRALDISQAMAIVPGATVNGTLDPANETDLYQFTADPGDQFYFDFLSASGGYTYWRLLDPYGRRVFGPGYMPSGDIGVTTLNYAGVYTLLIEGRRDATGIANYSFNVQKVSDDTAALVVESTVSGGIAHVGQRDYYNFTLSADTRLYFDSLTNNGNLNWTLTGPRGTVVSARSFTAADSGDLSGSAVYDLVAGDYTLVIDGVGDTVSDYSFRLLDVGQATAIVPGTVVDGTLDPAYETDLYQFTANAGDQFYFDYLSALGGYTYWRLLDPYGRRVFGPSYMPNGDIGVTTLNYVGVYTLLIEGRRDATGTASYSFNVDPRGNVPVAPLPIGDSLVLGATVANTLSVAGEQDHYNLTLAAPTRVYFDSLTSNLSLNWSLTGPRGSVVANRSMYHTDSWEFGYYVGGVPAYDLVAGEYVLTVTGTVAASYSFRLHDLANAATVVPGTPVSNALNPANETDLYQFSATAGERFYFDFISVTGSRAPYWSLLDPYGRKVFGPTSMPGGDIGVTTLNYDGFYTLFIEGRVFATDNSSYSFNIQKVVDDTTPVALNTTMSGSIDHAGQRDFYNFTLAADSRLYFDTLTNNANLNWTLTGPRGTVVSVRAFTASDGVFGYSVFDLVAGDYTLMIDGAGDTVGGYGFRLYDLSQATTLTLGTPVTGTLSPVQETDLYQFTANAGERFFFDVTHFNSDWAYYAASWRLVDPYGQIAFDSRYLGGSPDIELALKHTGTYTLLVEGRQDAIGTTSYSFNVQKISDESSPLVIGQSMGPGLDWGEGKLGGAFSLDGARYGEVAHNADINLTNSLTLEAWINVDRFPQTWTPILYKGNGSSSRTYTLWLNSNVLAPIQN